MNHGIQCLNNFAFWNIQKDARVNMRFIAAALPCDDLDALIKKMLRIVVAGIVLMQEKINFCHNVTNRLRQFP